MDNLWAHSVTVFMGFFAIMNPIANTPVFLALTTGDDQQTTRAVALRAVFLAFIIVTVFAVAGKIIFHVFGITLPAFRITGGLLVFIVGYHMLQGKKSDMHHTTTEETGASRAAALGVAVSPLAMPLLAGPGTIATAMNFSARGSFAEPAITIAAFAVMCAITFVCFVFGGKLVAFVGSGVLGVITRLMGLILAVIGVQMLIEGIQGAAKLVE